jgi:hypothetical protein
MVMSYNIHPFGSPGDDVKFFHLLDTSAVIGIGVFPEPLAVLQFTDYIFCAIDALIP